MDSGPVLKCSERGITITWSLSASSIAFTSSSYATFISSLPFSCQGAKADPVFETPSCSLVRHPNFQSIWRCHVGVLALTKVYLEMESSCAFGPQQTQCFTVIKGRNRTVSWCAVNEQKQLNNQELYRLLFGIFFPVFPNAGLAPRAARWKEHR